MGTEFEKQPLDTAVAPTFWNLITAGKRTKTDFPVTAPAAQAVFFRTYSRHGTSGRETWEQVCDRTINGLKKLGQLDEEETARVVKMMRQLKSLPSGRWLWVGGLEWLEQQENFSGAYNCTSTNVVDWRAFGLMMDLAMMGCGTGAVIVQDYINQLPPIRNRLQVKLEGKIGSTPARQRRELTEIKIEGNQVYLYVGDSRHGWVKSYQTLLELAADEKFAGVVEVIVNLADVRPAGEVLKGFGGVANPVNLPGLYQRCANILNKAVGRQLNSVECCLLIDEAAVTIVSGNIRRCLPEDALVHTAQGLVPIAKVRVGDRVLTSKGFYSVTNFFVQGEQSLCRIQTQDGFFECTADHKVAVFTDVYGNYKMVKAQDLQSGERLVFVPQAIPGTPTELPEFRGKVGSKSKRITVPALTSDVAYFIGYLHGDGSVSSDGSRVSFRVHEDSPKILERLIAVGREFGLETYTLRPPQQCRTKAYELQFNSSALNQYLKSFKQAFQSLNVPDCILLGTVDIRKAYLAGLADADGCPKQGVLVGSIHQRFLQQVQTLYASLGITVRLGGSIRKRTGKWEGELVTVGGAAFKAVENNKSQYSIQFSTQKRQTPKSFRDHGFPKAMVRPIINTTQYHWGAIHQQMTLPTPKMVPEATNLVPVKVLVVELNVRSAPTYDIEVATVHEFVCEGILVSNSAGMRQGGSEDQLFATAKENLWQQDEKGNWRIDPERDSLRMANHSRVFHHKPTLTECIEAVRKQYYSGEGAIQWAGEALARANCDLITTTEERTAFLKAYAAGEGKQWFQSQNRSMSPAELEHRLARFGLNPCGEIIGSNFHCVSGDTLLITRDGMHYIRSLVGESVEIWNGKRWSPVVPILTGTNRKLYRVSFSDGTFLDVTEKHRFFVRNRFGKAYMEMTAGELRHRLADCKYALHTEPFKIDYLDGKFVDSIWAYTLGQLVGDGAICQSNGKPLSWCAFQPESDSGWVAPQLQLRLYGAKSYQELAIAGRTSGQLRYYAENPETPCLLYTGFQDQFDANYVRNLKKDAQLLEDFAGWSREGILHFVAGLIDADGAATKSGGVGLYMSGYDRAYRIYLLLLKCGIRSSINLFARGGTATNLGIRQKDLWYIQITDCAAIPCQRVDTSGGHEPKFKGKWQIIRSVEPLEGEHDTFCFNEVEFHKGVFGGTLTGQCNLSEIHLNQIDPKNYREQEEAFTAGALAVASLLNHKFIEERYRYSREIDPIVGVSFTGLFDFFVHAFGVDWLRWWEEGRPDTVAGMDFKHTEQTYLNRWRETVEGVLWDYCHRHGLKRPNRCTTVQPAGCLDRTALRIFDQGLLYADEVVAPGSGETVGLDFSVRNGVATDTAIANQPLNLLRVTLKNGRVLRMTKNHRLSVEEKWVRADQLEIGMEIDYSLGQYRKQEDALLLSADPIQYTRVCRKELIGHSRGVLSKEILTPTTLNPDLGYFLGCLFGDGAMSEHKYRIRFSFNAQEFDLVERLQAIAQRCFGLTGSVNYDSRNHNSPAQARLGMSRGELVFACKQLFDWLNLNGLGKPTPQPPPGRGLRGWVGRIPQLIRQSSRETILSFFCGLIDTDGCVRKQGSLSIDSANEAFVRNLQQVGEAVGLCFSIFHNSQGNNLQGQKDMWGLCLSPMQSSKEALDYLNAQSRKCGLRPTPQPPSREGGYGGWVVFKPYQVVAIELETEPDYSYDFAVAGTDDNDSWYWQGALKSHNTKSLLTGASPGWHPPKAQRFIRRITFRKNDPVALACLDYGYKVVPSQSDKDEKGNLLNDPFDLRCTEWLVEIPTEVSWANIPGADTINISKFSALAQMDFYMNVQRYYTRHNSSATIELREHEIEALGIRIYEAIRDDEGYISAALLARFDDHQTFPRLPFEPIDKETYVHMIEEVKLRRLTEDFHSALSRYDSGDWLEAGPAGCDSDKCLLPEQKP